MSITINAADDVSFLSSFAEAVGSKVNYGRVIIPEEFGHGYVMGYLFSKNLRMVVRNYVLLEEIIITRHPDWLRDNMVMISFSDILKPAWKDSHDQNLSKPQRPSVTITTNGFEPELHLRRDQSFNDIHLGVDAAYLRELLATQTDHPVLKNIMANAQPLVFEEVVSAALQKTATEIAEASITPPMHHFFYQLKTQELICYLLMELGRRNDHKIQALNSRDIRMLYAVRDQIELDLSQVPILPELAAFAGMSESKLKRLFKQVFGINIYSYYQSLRMREAAFLLNNKNMSVSEVGYALGFVNLSHFTRVFEAHMGLKPKKYAISVNERGNFAIKNQ